MCWSNIISILGKYRERDIDRETARKRGVREGKRRISKQPVAILGLVDTEIRFSFIQLLPSSNIHTPPSIPFFPSSLPPPSTSSIVLPPSSSHPFSPFTTHTPSPLPTLTSSLPTSSLPSPSPSSLWPALLGSLSPLISLFPYEYLLLLFWKSY